ncbi:MAG: protein phosphatase 2C domain-containing protein [Clostridia bacterium]|nr:protein phosphatase 2C domain-containing protein [Clostridia bacterium]MBQ8845493.1 protein phosphatase 2C domain-containing protein [Clostridia bacterium]
MKLGYFTKAARNNNEDFGYVCEDFGFIVDGATSVSNIIVTNEVSDAKWFSHKLGGYLKEALKDTQRDLKDIVKDAIVYVDSEFTKFYRASMVETKPSSTIAIFRKNNGLLEYLVLGDSPLLVKYKDGQIRELIANEQLIVFERENIKKLVEIANQREISVIEARPFVNEALLQQRLKMNKEGGYYIIADDVNAVDHALCGTIRLDVIQSVMGMSDGFSQLYDVFEKYTKKQLFKEVENGKPFEELYRELYKCQENDKDCNEHPRFKVRDDVSVFYAEI